MPPRPPPRARGHFGPDASRPTSGTAPKPAPSWRPSSLALGARTILTSTTGVHYRFRIRARTFATAKGLRDLWSPFCLRRATPGLLKSTVSRQNVLRDVAGRRQRAPAPSCRMAGDSPGGPRPDLRSRQARQQGSSSRLRCDRISLERLMPARPGRPPVWAQRFDDATVSALVHGFAP